MALVDEKDEQENNTFLDLPTPGPGSSVSQTSGNSLTNKKRPRQRTSNVYAHCSIKQRLDGQYYVCNHCPKIYAKNGGTSNVTRYLKEKHHWDPVASGIAKKRQMDGSTVDAAFCRGAEANIAKEKQRREDLLATGLNQATLEYLYIQWIVECDLPFYLVTHKPFRAFLEYISAPANKMLPNAASTIKNHAFELFIEGKRRLRHTMLTAVSDIHITCDMWTSPNHLGILAVVTHFTAESLESREIILAIKEL